MTSSGERIDLGKYAAALRGIDSCALSGKVTDVVGLLIESDGPAVALGDFCEMRVDGRLVRVQVIGFRGGRVLTMPLEETDGISPGDLIVARRSAARLAAGPGLIGRVLDGFGRPMDGRPIQAEAAYELFASPPGPLEREPITEPLITGVRAINGLLPCGRGQRVGLFGGSGVGKSTLLGSMVRNSECDVAVVALVGERNREVRAFLEEDLGPEGMARTVAVVSTSDRPALLRLRACFVALAAAEYFRDQGANVLLVIDSVTRLAMAQREIGLAAGEPPSQKGYTPSVFNLLPRIFERAGNFRIGSITGFFSVLVEGDDFNEPVADAVRSILDGHIVLSRELGAAGHYPAIDVLNSVSRLTPQIASEEQKSAANALREAMATYRRAEDLINLGAYAAGSNPKIDAAIKARGALEDFLRQPPDARTPFEQTLRRMQALAEIGGRAI